jgi:tetratricopeptide (TPR) repeat protein
LGLWNSSTATNLYEQALITAQQQDNTKTLAECLTNFARIQLALGETDEALKSYQSLLSLTEKSLLASHRYVALKGLAQAHSKLKKPIEA